MTMYSHLAKGFAEVAADNLAEVNQRKLNACALHAFDCRGINWKRKTVPAELRCVMCGGFMPFEEAKQYAKGYAASGENPEVVIEGFGR